MAVIVKRGIALFLLAFGFCMAVVALVNINWVDQRDLAGGYGTYRIGLRQIVDSGNVDVCSQFDLDNLGEGPNCLWNTNLLGEQYKWSSAGEGALGIGAIGVILLGFSALFALLGLCLQSFTKIPGALLAFLSGITFLIGALVFDQMRPKWGGDMGYNYPMGLYLAAGLMTELAAIVLWSADYVGEVVKA